MARKRRRRSPSASHARVEQLERDLAACSARMDDLEAALATNIRRMGEMQVEIDRLRSLVRSN